MVLGPYSILGHDSLDGRIHTREVEDERFDVSEDAGLLWFPASSQPPRPTDDFSVSELRALKA